MDRVSKAEREIVRKMMTKTNYDRLISKTPEELAEFLSEYRCVRKARYCMEADCTQCWLDWLKSPVEETK